jgi:hypothetical protein
MEALVAGLSVILAGKGDAPGGLLPPHAGNNRNKERTMRTSDHRTQPNLPMQPLAASLGIREARRFSQNGLKMNWNGKLL